jgi:NAD+ synthase (glutamine-hydrolysing)
MPGPARDFFDIYAHGFVRVALAVPQVRLADPAHNAAEIVRLHREASANGAALVTFPELCLSGYSLEDLHQQDGLLRAVVQALATVAEATATTSTLLVVGAPLRFDGRLHNCACVLSGGRILGVVPKSYLPNYREFYEKRQFAAARDAVSDTVPCLDGGVPFGADLLFRDLGNPDFCVHVEICEDVWAPIPPSTYAALRGATVLVNLSASNVTIGKSGYRRELAAGQSAKTLSAYLYSAAGAGESTTDLAWDGDAFVYEDGELLGAAERFGEHSQIIYADVDLERLVQERARMTSFIDCATDHRTRLLTLRVLPFTFRPPDQPTRLRRSIARHPYVPADPTVRDARCYEAYSIQVSGLVQRLRATGLEKVVIGVSGGLDSTHALIVAARAMDRLGYPRTNVLAYSMPGFATSGHTRENALALMHAVGVSAAEIDIRPSCRQMFEDIDHPFARGEKVYDIAFENVQAGERTSHLFRLANQHGALVVGTGDLSELALGWCTYGVGDQMAHYSVNVSVPKTLVRHLIAWVADRDEAGARVSPVLRRILATRISPELVPGHDVAGPAQDTEAAIGPFDLHDFHLYYVSRRGYGPAKVAFLCAAAWANDLPGAAADTPYVLADLLRWQRVFLDRFFRTSQFKRSAIPNGPKVGSGGSLSPRGDWRAPSDSTAAAWLAALDATEAWIRRSRST